MTTTPEIICDVFSLLDKDEIERIQLVSQFWNNITIRHKNILPLRQFFDLYFGSNQIHLYETERNFDNDEVSYIINFDRTNLRKNKKIRIRYSYMSVDEVLKNLKDVVFDRIQIFYCEPEDRLDNLLNLIKLATKKTGGKFHGRFGRCYSGRFNSEFDEILDNHIIVNELEFGFLYRPYSYIREVCANPEIVQLPSTPKEIRLACLEFEENEEVLHFTCNGKLNGANRLIIGFKTSKTNYGNFIRQWFELYRTHQNPISLVGKFEFRDYDHIDIVLDAVKTFLNNTQLRVKYSLETKEFHRSSVYRLIKQYVKRSCVLHETDSYALMIEMAYEDVTEMSSIIASDLDQPPCDQMLWISFCVKSL